MTEQQDTTP